MSREHTLRNLLILVIPTVVLLAAPALRAEAVDSRRPYLLVASRNTGDPTAPEPNTVSTPLEIAVPESCRDEDDSLWILSTRHMTTQVRHANLDQPPFRVTRLDPCGRQRLASLDEYLMGEESELRVIYVHGNRMDCPTTLHRALLIQRCTMRHRAPQTPNIRWLVWSWPSDQEGLLLRDARLKAYRTESQGLYLAWLLRELIDRGHRPRLIGFSFGARITTGSLHALAGGRLSGRQLPGHHIEGAYVSAGLLAPALGKDWLCEHGYHGRATRNLQGLTVLYNRHDAILKRYPFLDPGNEALGYHGPQGFGPRFDGSALPVESRNCSGAIGRRHAEEDYYMGHCDAGTSMFQVITVQ